MLKKLKKNMLLVNKNSGNEFVLLDIKDGIVKLRRLRDRKIKGFYVSDLKDFYEKKSA